MSTVEERQHKTLEWARYILTDPTFTHYIARGDEACALIEKQVRMVVRWAMANDTAAADDTHWAVAHDWLLLSPARLREIYQDAAVRGSWLIAVGGNKLARFDLATGRPKTWAAAPTMGTLSDYEIDRRIFGW